MSAAMNSPYPPTMTAVLQDMGRELESGSKRCACCGRVHDAAAWYALPFVGVQTTPEDMFGPEERLELRNCPCGSTLARIET